MDTLASKLVGDGLPRKNPFAPLGFKPPAVVQRMGYAEEAKEVLKIATKARKVKGASKETLDAAKDAERSARAVTHALGPIPALKEAYKAALLKRDALAQPWETAFAALKRGARAAEDDGAKGLFAALFERPAKPRKRKQAKPAAVTTT